MSPSPHLREEVRGAEGAETPPARARGKTEVTPKKNVSPRPKEERRESKKAADGQQKFPTARGKVEL